ncbi:hypothetical protein ACTWP4_02535 [Gracilibacillus sp. D59]|uniref:hypothetical protein n=1 Tax=Gracilibacillus sp. D59 TaxID=3457434 RepID=UPI003FCDAF34
MKNNIGKKITIVPQGISKNAEPDSTEWALDYFIKALEEKWCRVETVEKITEDTDNDITVFIEEKNSHDHSKEPSQAESFVIEKVSKDNLQILSVTATDSRGLVYALLELADIVQTSADPLADLLAINNKTEYPTNSIRSIKRLFANEKTDKLWFYNKDFWREYLTELALHRFNRFSLALGMGYDIGHDPDIKDFYFCFAYPFLVSVSDYDVSVEGLSQDEREKNLEMLRFIGQETKRRGMDFQVGLWTHAYEPEDSPNIRYKIKGLDKENHALYCRDALKTLLQDCPEIDGVTIRVHYESGIPEPAHLFWEIVLKGVSLCGRSVKLDLHPKGIDDDLLKIAEDNGVPFMISPKFWAEHMGLPYHQAAIRETELPVEPNPEAGKMIITTTSRRFTRYGYADFLKEDRNYDMLYRIWPGTQRVLLWGDPEMAAGYSRAGSFGGAKGIEVMEPLSFKSRKTSETDSGRDPIVDPELRFGLHDWKKYMYTYRLWGRLLYNPDTDPEVWRRYLKSEFSSATESCENALKYASRILPLVTVAHAPSVANNHYWPEIYANIMIVDQEHKPANHCDGREPHTFNVASPLDPALFYRVDEYADDMMQNRKSGKISPLETANILEQLALSAEKHLQHVNRSIDKSHPTFRRWAVDVETQIGLGLFFANKFRAGTAYAFYEKVGDGQLLENALSYYRVAKKAWERIVSATEAVYTSDITFGYVPYMRGHWSDRLPEINEDILKMEAQTNFAREKASGELISRSKEWLKNVPKVPLPTIQHVKPEVFSKGERVPLSIKLSGQSDTYKVTLKYRQVNQAEKYQSVQMYHEKDELLAEIPASYTNSPYPLVYFFEIEDENEDKKFYPGFNENLSNQPYFLIRQ